jgi:hypothetical protein
VGRRARVGGAEVAAGGPVPGAPRPRPDQVPDWSADTREALAALTPLERAFAQHYATGGNSAEAYRKAADCPAQDRDADTSRMNGYAIRSRPRVQAAIALAMRDVNFDARLDRAWMLQRLQVALDRAEASAAPGAPKAAADIVRIIAEMKGEIVHRSEQSVTVTAEATPAVRRLLDTFELARRKAAAAGLVVRAPEALGAPPAEPAGG